MYQIILQCLTQNPEDSAKKLTNTLTMKKDASDLAVGVNDGMDEIVHADNPNTEV